MGARDGVSARLPDAGCVCLASARVGSELVPCILGPKTIRGAWHHAV